MEYGNEDIEEIIWYKEFDRVVFMEYNYLLLFDRSLFIFRQNERGEKYIALTQSGDLTNYSRLRCKINFSPFQLVSPEFWANLKLVISP